MSGWLTIAETRGIPNDHPGVWRCVCGAMWEGEARVYPDALYDHAVFRAGTYDEPGAAHDPGAAMFRPDTDAAQEVPRTKAGRDLLAHEDLNSRPFPLITAEAIRAIEDEAALLASDGASYASKVERLGRHRIQTDLSVPDDPDYIIECVALDDVLRVLGAWPFAPSGPSYASIAADTGTCQPADDDRWRCAVHDGMFTGRTSGGRSCSVVRADTGTGEDR